MRPGALTRLAQLSEDDARSQAQRLGKALRTERERIGATLRDLRAESGLALGFLCDVEHGRRWATHDAAWRLEVALTRLAAIEEG